VKKIREEDEGFEKVFDADQKVASIEKDEEVDEK
jgi:hypothetical protein